MISEVIPFHPEAARSPIRKRILFNPLSKELSHLDPLAAENKSARTLLAPVPGIGNYYDRFFGHGIFLFRCLQ